ncbi:MAG: hypothetical protein QOG90_1474 [Actinomycetota bacterium]
MTRAEDRVHDIAGLRERRVFAGAISVEPLLGKLSVLSEYVLMTTENRFGVPQRPYADSEDSTR